MSENFALAAGWMMYLPSAQTQDAGTLIALAWARVKRPGCVITMLSTRPVLPRRTEVAPPKQYLKLRGLFRFKVEGSLLTRLFRSFHTSSFPSVIQLTDFMSTIHI